MSAADSREAPLSGREQHLDAFAIAYGIVFVAELGDKSMLMVMAMASRYPWKTVLIAAAVAVAFVMAVAVLFGQAAEAVLPGWALATAAGLLFIGFGVVTFAAAGKAEEEEGIADSARQRGPLLLPGLAAAIILAEIGDKTQLAVISLSGLNPAERLLTWAGATAGMLTVLVIAIVAGARFVRVLPARLIGRLAGAVFIAFGVIALVAAARELTA